MPVCLRQRETGSRTADGSCAKQFGASLLT
jgi:hypothetical protein